jgi:hydrogenase maturation protein HypF
MPEVNHLDGLQVRVRGIVQGVGFRPFIYNLALQNQLTGWVRNTSSGVEIEVNGAPPALECFLKAIKEDAPPLARIDAIESQSCPPDGYTHFEIQESRPNPGDFMPISPDVSICADCRRELFDPADRRYRYPFTNCTNCGPRFTIIKDIPYDRPNTTMANFELCPRCRAEYENPRDRRFHAQPVACPDCGPQVWFEAGGQRLGEGEDAIQTARAWLKQGKILAVKGLGGFHLACDATNPAAVAELRQRKRRSDKPFGLMAFDLEAAARQCLVTEADQALLQSPAHPIVLLERRPEATVALEAAPYQHSLGIMLPYTPLHLLLLEPGPDFPDVLVMTSANLSEEPIAYEDIDARSRLVEMADGFLMHDRPIHMRVDDSVVRSLAPLHQGEVAAARPYFSRRSRGYAPNPLSLPEAIPSIFAAGAELKNTFCLTRQDYAFISHHIGDLENYETLCSFEEAVAHYERLFRITPERLACDLHPNYLASRYAQERATHQQLPLVQVQHHHAHLAACLAENGWTSADPVIGLSFDGTGLGTDNAVWGGEFLLGGYQGYQRLYHLAYTPLPGGDLAVRKPARMALAHLWQSGLDWESDLPPVQGLCMEERTALRGQLEHHINTPNTSSMGRLFDAVAALLGVRQVASYEGQAAMELEALADPGETGCYALAVQDGIIDPQPLLEALIAAWRAATPLPILSARFHNSLANMSLEVCQAIRRSSGSAVVALSGGVWQNQFLLKRTRQALTVAGFQVLIHHLLPPNDGCIALGQALIAAKASL